MITLLLNWLDRLRSGANLKELKRGYNYAAGELLSNIYGMRESTATPELIARVMEGHTSESWFDRGMRAACSTMADATFKFTEPELDN